VNFWAEDVSGHGDKELPTDGGADILSSSWRVRWEQGRAISSGRLAHSGSGPERIFCSLLGRPGSNHQTKWGL